MQLGLIFIFVEFSYIEAIWECCGKIDDYAATNWERGYLASNKESYLHCLNTLL